MGKQLTEDEVRDKARDILGFADKKVFERVLVSLRHSINLGLPVWPISPTDGTCLIIMQIRLLCLRRNPQRLRLVKNK